MATEHRRIGAFISIPKNASKTVLSILELGRNRDIENTDSPIIYENHQRGTILKNKYDLENLFVFCFSRNPYDRCISWYEYHRFLEPYSSMSFTDWIKSGLPHHWIKQNATNYPKEGISPLLQYNFVENCKIDFIGRIENFQEGLQTVIEKLNIICEEKQVKRHFIFKDRKLNSTSNRRSDIDYYYTQETKDIVYSLLQKDFHFFDYKR